MHLIQCVLCARWNICRSLGALIKSLTEIRQDNFHSPNWVGILKRNGKVFMPHCRCWSEALRVEAISLRPREFVDCRTISQQCITMKPHRSETRKNCPDNLRQKWEIPHEDISVIFCILDTNVTYRQRERERGSRERRKKGDADASQEGWSMHTKSLLCHEVFAFSFECVCSGKCQ